MTGKNMFRRLSLFLILFAFLFLPVAAMAGLRAVGPTTEQGGDCPGGQAQGGAAQSGTGQGCPTPKRQNAAEAINVKLQVPLPFVPLTCKDKEGNPAVCKLTDYIAGMYRLLVGLGALFAVVMLIIAGYQWIFAGGSADKIGAAKKRIMGAVMGLILALLSYVILNSISARLVELRLPLVDPVPGIAWGGSGEFCENSEAIKAYAATYGKSQTPALTPEQAMAKLQFNSTTPSADGSIKPVPLAETVCGRQYSIAGVDSVGTCKGKVCTVADTSCVLDKCLPIYLSGSIAWGIATGLDQQNFFSNAYVDFIEVYAICDNKAIIAQTLDTNEKSRRFDMPRAKVLDAVPPYRRLAEWNNVFIANRDADKIAYRFEAEKCPAGKFKGFALSVEVNDDHNKFWSTSDDNFALGKGCSVPLGRSGAVGFSPAFGDVNWANIDSGQLFSVADFDAGATCNISVDRNLFPAQN